MSPLTQGRELKRLDHAKNISKLMSPLTQGRELKHSDKLVPLTANHSRPSRRGVN